VNDEQAMREALVLAVSPDAPRGENPRVGCLIIRDNGVVVGRGYHRGAGTAHAEIEALEDAGERAAGAAAFVTLEPCRHTGRTGPCADALIEAGVTRVVFGQSDPTDAAGGGADVLRDAGVEVVSGILAEETEAINAEWTFAVGAGRPFVTWKVAVSLDGRVAGPDGGPTAITGESARADVHDLRSTVGAIIVGTGTALADNPSLTVRRDEPMTGAPPLRVIVGSREIAATAQVRDDQALTLIVEADPAEVLAQLYDRGVRHALLEGGPTLASAFLEAGLVDRVVWYVAPLMLGSGPVALPPGASRPMEVAVSEVAVVGEDVRITGMVNYQRVES